MDRFYDTQVTVTAGTLTTAPLTQAVIIENSLLIDVELIVPNGHVGLTGIRVRMSQQQVLPWGNNSWITANDYIRVFPVNVEIGSRTMSIQAYNLDAFPHSFTVRFHIQDLPSLSGQPPLTPGLPVAGAIALGSPDLSAIGDIGEPGSIPLPTIGTLPPPPPPLILPPPP